MDPFASANDADVYAGTRRAALRVLENAGLFRGENTSHLRDATIRAIAAVNLEGPNKPYPSPWRITEVLAGGCVAMAAICAMLEEMKGKPGLVGTVDVEQANWIALNQYTIEWEIEGGGMWKENNDLVGWTISCCCYTLSDFFRLSSSSTAWAKSWPKKPQQRRKKPARNRQL
jgi:hypothetical protein